MQERVLLEFIARQVHTDIHVFDPTGNETDTILGVLELEDPHYQSFPLGAYRKLCIEQGIPLFFSYGAVNYAIVNRNECLYLIGPLRLEGNPIFYHHIDGELDAKWLSSVYLTNLVHFSEHVLLLHNIADARQVLSLQDLLVYNLAQRDFHLSLQKRYTDLLFENQENAVSHNPYTQELREQASIEEGNLDALEESFSEVYNGQIGRLSKDSLRNLKNLGIVLVTLASRSAIRGGLSPELSFSLSDTYIQQIEDMTNPNNLLSFIREMERHYTTLVKEQKEALKGKKNNPHIERCKDYIFSHLHDRITVASLAKTLGYHPDYLSHLFKSIEGIGISQYIIREKINRSKNLLTYTQYSYSTIAFYLGFSSQSHFGKHFKVYTGMTPAQFRLEQQSTQADFHRV